MQAAHLICLVTFYSSIMVSIDSVDVDRVGTMNELLSYSGWSEFNPDLEYLKVIIQWMETEQHVHIRQLLEVGANEQIVSKDNIDLKIGLAHQFLSCKYADVLIRYCELKKGIVHQCTRVENTSRFLKFFKEFLEHLIEDNDRLMRRIRGALMVFYELYPNNVLNNDVYQIVEDFRNIYNAKQLEGIESKTGSEIIGRIDAIKNDMSDNVQRLSAFFNCNCSLYAEDEIDYNVLESRALVEYATDENTPGSAVCIINEEINKIVDKCIKAHYELLGFEYDSESGTTRVDYDPERTFRIDQMNTLLSFRGWSWMETASIIENWENRHFISRYTMFDKSPDGTIVNKTNVGEKIRHIHQFLSCEFVVVMKTFHDHLTGILNECSKINTTDGWKHFWVIVKQIDSVVLHMRGSFLCLHRLSPQTEYKKDVYEMLEELKNFYDSVDLSENWLIGEKTKLLTEKLNPLYNFFKFNCWTNPSLFDRSISEDTGHSIQSREQEFNELIKEFTEYTFGSIGFKYNPESTNVKSNPNGQ